MKISVEWLVEHLNLDETSPNYNNLTIKKAKEMHRKEMENSYNQGLQSNFQDFEQYYNETFKSE